MKDKNGLRRSFRTADPAVLFFGVFGVDSAVIAQARAQIETHFGGLHRHGVSPEFPFPDTETYRQTMGTSLRRQFFALEALQPQDVLADVKHKTIEIESAIADGGDFEVPRPINIDPGLLNDCRVILATTKDYAHRIYRDRGIWEEVTLIFRGGRFEALPWTYPDFRQPAYHEYFTTLRDDLFVRLGKRKRR